MSVSVNVTVSVPVETLVAIREVAHPEDNHELINQVASDTVYTIIDAIRGDLYDINVKPAGSIHCRAPRIINIRVMKLSDGRYFDCDIANNATGRELAVKIHDEQNIPLLKQVLMFHGVVFFRRDSKESVDLKLDRIGVSDGSKIVLGWRF